MVLCFTLYKMLMVCFILCIQETTSETPQKTQLQSQDSGFGSQGDSQRLLETDSQMEGSDSTPMDVDSSQSNDKSQSQPTRPSRTKAPRSPVPSKKPPPPESPDTLSLMCDESLDDSDPEQDKIRTITPPRGTEILHTQVYNIMISWVYNSMVSQSRLHRLVVVFTFY